MYPSRLVSADVIVSEGNEESDQVPVPYMDDRGNLISFRNRVLANRSALFKPIHRYDVRRSIPI